MLIIDQSWPYRDGPARECEHVLPIYVVPSLARHGGEQSGGLGGGLAAADAKGQSTVVSADGTARYEKTSVKLAIWGLARCRAPL